MLKEIAIVTITVANLSQVEDAWREHFDYQVTERGAVSAELAEHWAASGMQGREYVVMQPSNAAPAVVRFVASAAAAAYQPMTSHGWNATELLVANPDPIAAGMADSAFSVIGAPRALWDAPDAPRVMQAIGPGRELLYLTSNPGAAAALGLDASMPAVERPFIMVAGGGSMQAFQDFYGAQLGLAIDPPIPFPISTISRANDLDLQTTYPLALVNLAPGYFIELDELPAVIPPRDVTPGELPVGIAMVSFTVDRMPGGELDWVTRPHIIERSPYAGARVGILRGPAGELLELIQRPETPQ
ncbi:MAG: hypothetical protein V2J12_01720 [Gammaproteobacteria bacterium]|jgi:hypothetical protein|nr:hypothetical protein [Gammaproteobacteria bacterium]